MQATDYTSFKIIDNQSSKIEDTLVIEAPLQININGESYTVVMRTPADDKELIRGLLYAEDIYKQKENLVLNFIKNEKFSTIINVSKKYSKNVSKNARSTKHLSPFWWKPCCCYF